MKRTRRRPPPLPPRQHQSQRLNFTHRPPYRLLLRLPCQRLSPCPLLCLRPFRLPLRPLIRQQRRNPSLLLWSRLRQLQRPCQRLSPCRLLCLRPFRLLLRPLVRQQRRNPSLLLWSRLRQLQLPCRHRRWLPTLRQSRLHPLPRQGLLRHWNCFLMKLSARLKSVRHFPSPRKGTWGFPHWRT